MNKHRALEIANSIHKTVYQEWRIPHHYKCCVKEMTLPNGELGTLVMEDEVYDFLAYIKKLIENSEDN